MRSLIKLFAVAGVAVLLTACGTTGGLLNRSDDGASVEERQGGEGGYGATAQGAAGSGMYQGQVLDINDPTSPLNQRTIYFEYDSAEVTAEGRDILAAHAAYLAANPDLSMTLEGHADERGSREYNIGLGERRALSVRSLLLFLGAVEGQLKIVSWGEEKPVAAGHDDDSWRLNRRVELVYPERR